jgi:hypothetical protein
MITARFTFTLAQAVQIARKFDVVAAQVGSFKADVSAMKAANPKLVLLAYVEGAFDMTKTGTQFPLSWYAHDATGNRIQVSPTVCGLNQGCGNWLMDLSNSNWVAMVGSICATEIVSSGYDGCYVDNLGDAPLYPGQLTSSPINPATSQVWTQAEWLAATTNIAANIETANPGHIIVGNGLFNGQGYFSKTAPTSQLLSGMSAGSAEMFIRANDAITTYKPETLWKQDVDMLVDAQQKGSGVMAMTRVWVTATADQTAAWHQYALASYLLATNGHSFFTFLAAHTNEALTADYAIDHVALGYPLGPYVKVNGIYQRLFNAGMVLVNPTAASVTVTLPATYRDVQGLVVTAVTLTANTSYILTKV